MLRFLQYIYIYTYTCAHSFFGISFPVLLLIPLFSLLHLRGIVNNVLFCVGRAAAMHTQPFGILIHQTVDANEKQTRCS